MVKVISRRLLLSGLSAGLAIPAWANAPERSIRPASKPADFFKRTIPTAADLIAEAGLGGKIGFVVADARSGEVLEAKSPLLSLPPASVAKAITAAYGISALGLEHRFTTDLVATGPVKAGVVQGDLVLLGGGDPTLDTNALADMARALKAKGVTGITGDFIIDGAALPYQNVIDPGQPDHVGYNPAISGVNLNFNRVHFEWKREGAGFGLSMDARSDQYRPSVRMAQMQVIDRDLPVYTYRDDMGIDSWTVARGALGKGGARWLPVRRPDRYAGEVFQSLARAQGIRLPAPKMSKTGAKGRVLVSHRARPLADVVRGMLKYSTNLTAEVIGLSASQARGADPVTLAQSGAMMTDWVRSELGARRVVFHDHSGLSDQSRVSASDMVRVLVNAGTSDYLAELMKNITPKTRDGRPNKAAPYQIRAKTGTLNFVSSLAGYLTGPDGRLMVFAIFTADLDRRASIVRADRERPKGAKRWSRRSRWLQHQLLARWAMTYGA